MNSKIERQIKNYYAYLVFMGLSMVSIIMTLYLEYVGFSLYEVGVLLGVLQIGKTLLEIPTGFVADRFGNRVSLILAIVIEICAYALLIILRSFSAMIAVMILLAISYTLTTGCASSIVTNSLIAAGEQERLTRVNAVSRVLYYCCYGLTAVGAGFLSEISYELVIVLSIASLMLALLTVWLMQEDRGEIEANGDLYNPLKVAKYILGNRMVFYYALIEAATAWAMVPIDNFYNNYLNSYFGIPLHLVGVVIAVQFLFTSLFGLYSTRLALRFKEGLIVRIGPIASLALFFLFSLCHNPIAALVFYFAGLAVFCLTTPVRMKLLQVNVSLAYRVTVTSFNSILISLLSSVSQPLFGWVSGVVDMRQAMSLLLIISIVAVTVVNLMFSNRALGLKVKAGS